VDFATLEDQELLQQIVTGKEEALAALYDRYGGLVFSVALRIVQDRQSAEEITLDTFKRVWNSSHTYLPERGKIRNWLAAMARNRSIDYLRREKVRPETVSLSWVEREDKAAVSVRTPESAVRLRLERERVRQALAQLPQEQQEALALAYFGGFSQSEIAGRLQQPLGTVKTRIRLAMQKMRYLLHDV
jgi:RNA polymerase sigma-70 factor (ECF subfamily)